MYLGEFNQTNATNTSLSALYAFWTAVDIIYLTVVAIVGILGNLMVICSIAHANKVYRNGNIFIINLAVADLIVTGLLTPPIIANLVVQRNVLPQALCDAAGYMICTSCVISVHSLAVISLNRYWAVVKNDTFCVVFSKKRCYVMVAVIWLWSHILTLPVLLGWSDAIYDELILVCTFDNNASRDYTILIMVIGIFAPMSLTCYFYVALFRNVKMHDHKIKKLRRESTQATVTTNKKKVQKREKTLIKTLVTSCVVFVISWSPYMGYIIFTPRDVDPLLKRVVARLILSNSAMNFIIYGLMSKGYRNGYKELLIYIWKKLKLSSEP